MTETPETIPLPSPPRPLLGGIPPVPFVLLTLLAIFILYQVGGGVITFLTIGGMVTEENLGGARWITAIGQLLLMLLPAVILARLRHRPLKGFFRFRWPTSRETMATIVGVFALQQVLQGYMAFQESIPLPESVERVIDPIKDMIEETYRLLVASRSPGEFLVVVLVVALIPSIAEELLFRGLVQRNLEQVSTGAKPAVAVGILFAAYHLNPFTFVPLAVLGIYFGFLVYRSGTITLSMIAHFFNNFLACFAVYVGLGEDFMAVSPATGASPGDILLNTLLFIGLFALTFVYFLQITGPRTNPPTEQSA
jgi:membrane protease YdiL (CAAX protease family)